MYHYIDWCTHWLPLLLSFPKHHVGFISGLTIVLSKVISIFKQETNGSVPLEASDSEIEPIFSIGVIGHICIALDFDGERVVGGDVSSAEIASGEATVHNDIVIKVEIVSIGMPQSLFLLTWPTLIHKQ